MLTKWRAGTSYKEIVRLVKSSNQLLQGSTPRSSMSLPRSIASAIRTFDSTDLNVRPPSRSGLLLANLLILLFVQIPRDDSCHSPRSFLSRIPRLYLSFISSFHLASLCPIFPPCPACSALVLSIDTSSVRPTVGTLMGNTSLYHASVELCIRLFVP